LIKRLQNIGPGLIITSAFIGPGTITLCTLVGVEFGYSLLWCIIFSLFATTYLQEMSSRLGIISRKGLSDVIKDTKNKIFKNLASILIIFSIFIGNCAYEAGNISGSIMGLETFLGSGIYSTNSLNINLYALLIGIFLILIILIGSYKKFEKLLISMVFIMSITFIITAILSKPNINDLLNGLVPTINNSNYLYVIGLIGTTVVPYNLFLHSYIAKKKWKNVDGYKNSLIDTIISISIGGIISISIIITASASNNFGINSEINNAIDLGIQLQPYFGEFSKYFISIGIFAAGITSSITAPIATSYALSGIFNYQPKWSNKKFKTVAITVIIIGVISSSINYSPIYIIKFAQFINGLFLPFIVIFLLWVMNQKQILGNYVNSKKYNLLGIIIVFLTLILCIKSLLTLFL